MAIIQNIILGLVQGLSEFLPISSSGHLLMFMNWFNFETNNMLATIMFHIGTLLSVVVYYFRDLLSLFKKENWGYILKLGIATLPAVVVALVAGDSVDSVFTSKYLWITFLITALLLYIAQRQQKYCVYKKEVGFLDSLIMGIMQAVAIVPGISRSGSTICGGILCGDDKEKVTKFSFLMSIPAILGSIIFSFGDIQNIEQSTILPTIVGMIVAFISGLCAIHIMTKFVSKGKFTPFIIYVVIIAIINLFTTI